jgi:hypothetical protein
MTYYTPCLEVSKDFMWKVSYAGNNNTVQHFKERMYIHKVSAPWILI